MNWLRKITFLLALTMTNIAHADFYEVTFTFMKSFNKFRDVVEKSDLPSGMKEDVNIAWFVGYDLYNHAEVFDQGGDSIENCEKARQEMKQKFENYINPTFSVMVNTHPKVFEAYKFLGQNFAYVLNSPIDRN